MAAPATPTLAITVLSATSFRATITGDSAYHYLYYATAAGVAWVERQVPGVASSTSIDVTGLAAGQNYYATAVSASEAGERSLPSTLQLVRLAEASTEGRGQTTLIEDWIVTTLKAIEHNEEDAFRTVDVWKGQLSPKKSGGIESLERYAPCAFVSFAPAAVGREGDNDRREDLRFEVMVGVTASQAGDARRGTATTLGYSRLRELVIEALDAVHPGAGFDCDELQLVDEDEVAETDTQYAASLVFRVRRITLS